MQVPYKLISLEELVNQVDTSRPVFADIENRSGFYSDIRLFQCMQLGWDEAVLVDSPDPLRLLQALQEWDIKFHNIHYDWTTVQQILGYKGAPNRYDCTLLLSRQVWPSKEKFTLDDVLKYTLGYDPYLKQGLDKKSLQKSDWSAYQLTEAQLTYAATDVFFMPELWSLCAEHTESQTYQLDKLIMSIFFKMQWNGMPVDPAKLNDLYGKTQEAINEIPMPVNVNSWQQVRPYIGENESDELALIKFWMLDGNEKARDVRTVRKLTRRLTFLNKFDTKENRIYGKFAPVARSGRATCKDQNLQQLPRATKGVFGYAPGAGKVLLYADYPQLELRSITGIANVSSMAKLFRENVDVHTHAAHKMLNSDVITKTDRQMIKTYNFNLLYGGGAAMLQSILLKQVELYRNERDIERDKRKWLNLWPEINAWQQRGIKQWRKGQMKQTPMGRKYLAKLLTDHLNIENQGAGAEVAKVAMHYMDQEGVFEVGEYNNFIHDSYIVSCDDDPDIYEPLAKTMAESMQKAWFEVSKLFKIKDLPMPITVSVGYNWGDIEDDDVENLFDYKLEGMEFYE